MDLDQLLSNSLKLQAARKAKTNKQLISEEAAELLAQTDKIISSQYWNDLGIVQHQHTIRCSCQVQTKTIEGNFLLQQHKTQPSSKALTRQTIVEDCEVVYLFETTSWASTCAHCTKLNAARLPEQFESLFTRSTATPQTTSEDYDGQTKESYQDDSEEYSTTCGLSTES